MARQTQWVASGVYQPTHRPRRAYGPRRSSTYRAHVDDPAWAGAAIVAADVARYPAAVRLRFQLVSLRMPKGGERHLLVCPHCSARSTRLYEQYHRGFGEWETACRRCWGLTYRSRYEGRRPEAHPDYLTSAERRQIQRTPRDMSMIPCNSPRAVNRWRKHHRRMARYEAVQAVLDRRQRRPPR